MKILNIIVLIFYIIILNQCVREIKDNSKNILDLVELKYRHDDNFLELQSTLLKIQQNFYHSKKVSLSDVLTTGIKNVNAKEATGIDILKPWSYSKYFETKRDELALVYRSKNKIYYCKKRKMSFSDPCIINSILLISSVYKKDLKSISNHFINGVLEDIDPYSSILSEDEYQELKQLTQGEFAGMGLVVEEQISLPVVSEVLPNSPAEMSGLMANDVILKVNEQIIAFKKKPTMAKLIKSYFDNKAINIWVYRPSLKKIIKTKLNKDNIATQSVTAIPVYKRKDVLFLKIDSFTTTTSDEIYNEYLEHKKRVKYLILDLRNNPGGLYEQALKVSSLFIRKGQIVKIKTHNSSEKEYVSKNKKIPLPLLILINSTTASSSEIVTGCLKDHKRAIIIGTQSFGKASVQSIFELSHKQALKLTIAHYLTPKNHKIHNFGISPHIEALPLNLLGDEILEWGSIQQMEDTRKFKNKPPLKKIYYLNSSQRKENDISSLPAMKLYYPFSNTLQIEESLSHDPLVEKSIEIADKIFSKKNPQSIKEDDISKILKIKKERDSKYPEFQNSLRANFEIDKKYSIKFKSRKKITSGFIGYKIGANSNSDIIYSQTKIKHVSSDIYQIDFYIPRDVLTYISQFRGQNNKSIILSFKSTLNSRFEKSFGELKLSKIDYSFDTLNPKDNIIIKASLSKNEKKRITLSTELGRQIKNNNLYEIYPIVLTDSAIKASKRKFYYFKTDSNPLEIHLELSQNKLMKKSFVGLIGVLILKKSGELVGSLPLVEVKKKGDNIILKSFN